MMQAMMQIHYVLQCQLANSKPSGAGYEPVFYGLWNINVRLHANRRNIVDQQLPTLLDVTCCVRLHTLLHVVGCCCVLMRKV